MELSETRKKVQKSIQKGLENVKSIESRMRRLANDQNQLQIIDLIGRIAQNQVECKCFIISL